MAEINENNSGSGPPPGTPSKRAEKKQVTRSTPERMKSKEAEMMEIDLDEDQGPKTPPRIQSINKDEKAQDKAGMTTAMAIDCDPTPPNTPGRKDDKGRKATVLKRKEAQNSSFLRKRRKR